MRTRVVALRIIVALLTFLIGVTVAVVIGHINPFHRTRRCAVEERLVVYPGDLQEGFHHCPHMMHTAELKCRAHLGQTPEEGMTIQQETIQQAVPYDPPPPPAPPAPPRLPHRR
ncbi:MAG TPA: hypothetical protein VK619_03695 [Pyrinomonadaceae bacterium]|nr:hypothetical protein [Pyrinomonadaceae bacterium]